MKAADSTRISRYALHQATAWEGLGMSQRLGDGKWVDVNGDNIGIQVWQSIGVAQCVSDSGIGVHAMTLWGCGGRRIQRWIHFPLLLSLIMLVDGWLLV